MDAKQELESLEVVERSALSRDAARKHDERKRYLRRKLGLIRQNNNRSRLPEVMVVLKAAGGELPLATLMYRSGVGKHGIKNYIEQGHLRIVRRVRDPHNKYDRQGAPVIGVAK